MNNLEPTIKSQYAKFFESHDWYVFKQLAEHYLKIAVFLKKNNIDAEEAYKLWFRNVHKRLFIGLGCELLLKSHYLQSGYGINKPKKGEWHLYRIQDVNSNDYRRDDTYSMGFLIDQWKNGPSFKKQNIIEQGFRIAKVFRNKEGHIAVYWHNFDPSNYSDIEKSLMLFYEEAYSQKLNIQFFFEKNEEPIFSIED